MKNAALVYRNLFNPLSKLLIGDILNHHVATTEGTRYILETVLSPMYTQADIDDERSSMLTVINR